MKCANNSTYEFQGKLEHLKVKSMNNTFDLIMFTIPTT